MSETKPQKPLVSKGRYVWVMGKKGILYCSSAGVICLGLTHMILNIIDTVHDAFLTTGQSEPETAIPLGAFTPSEHVYFLILFAIWTVVSLFALWLGKSLFTKAKAIESVTIITQHNTGHLPAQDTLLRGSDLPPTVQQAELLRATQVGQETATEQLLRATTGDE